MKETRRAGRGTQVSREHWSGDLVKRALCSKKAVSKNEVDCKPDSTGTNTGTYTLTHTDSHIYTDSHTHSPTH